MKPIPDMIHVQIVNANNEPISNIAIIVRLFARHKNDYYCMPIKSNEKGNIEISRKWLNEEIEKLRNMFIMDFSSTLDDCEPKMEFRIMSIDEINNTTKSMTEWKDLYEISDAEIENLMKVDNANYTPMAQIVDFHGEDTVTVKLKIEAIRQLS